MISSALSLLQEFCKVFHKFFPFGETNDFAVLIFNTLDSSEDGAVGFKEFIRALSATAAGDTNERLKCKISSESIVQ